MQINKYTIDFRSIAESSWLELDSLYLGNVPKSLGTPNVFGLVTKNDKPFLCLKIYFKESNSVKGIIWKEAVVILCEKKIYFISLQSKIIQERVLDWFGGNFYPQKDILLITTNGTVMCFNEDATLIWKTNGLAEEIVTIEKVEHNIIVGQGRWEQPNIMDYSTYNPLEDLEPFKLDLQTGARLE